jgi:outer membrane immunogenic protein
MFRRILLAAAIAIALSDAALAAEPLPPPPPPIWTGFYAGLNAGYTFGGSNDVNLLTVPFFFDVPFMFFVADLPAALSGTGVLSAQNFGFIGGGQVGYNYQFGTTLVAVSKPTSKGPGPEHRSTQRE